MNLTAIFASIALVFGIGIGYKIGDWSGEKARTALEAEVAKGKIAENDLGNAKVRLEADNQKLQKDFDASQVLADARVKASDAKWASAASQQSATITALKSQISATKAALADLEIQLTLAKTPEEKAKIQAEIDAQNSNLATSESKERGVACLKEIIPENYVDLANGK